MVCGCKFPYKTAKSLIIFVVQSKIKFMKTLALFFLGSFVMASSCNKEDGGTSSDKPVAKFSISGYEVPTPCTISFINVSGNATSYLWNFGDGFTSTEFNPSHIYNFNGTYVLRLKVTGPGGVDSVCKNITVENPPPANKSSFSYFKEKCTGTPVGISFKTINPLSTNPVWDFGNGNAAFDRDPINQYLLPGDYTLIYSTMLNGIRDTVIRIIRIE
jgi:PKD repeat protein